jgi:hypothetical protein
VEDALISNNASREMKTAGLPLWKYRYILDFFDAQLAAQERQRELFPARAQFAELPFNAAAYP